ncbi:NINE protein [Comamonas sp. J-3]|uniref:NINE protein n=1 Tax=Comamonas trifloxystrobinivorans TaxID=3350256 RepID=UPI0037287361
MGEKNPRLAYRLLIAAGWLGAHRFYLHRYASAVAQLLLTALMVALWIWGGPFARWAPYLIGPILLWLIRDGFWLFDYFRVEEEMDTSLAAFVDSDSPAPKSAGTAASKAADAQARSLVEEAASADDAEARKKTRAIKLAKQQIALGLQENHPQAALTAIERLVKYLQQRSRRPQHDAHLAEAYLLHGMVLYQTQYLDAARKKLQMGVHLASSFAHLSVQTEQAKNWLEKLRNPQLKAAPGSPAPQVQPAQYEALMKAGEWAQASTLCAQTIALRQSAKTVDVPDLAAHLLNAMEIAQRLGQPEQVHTHGMQLLQLAQQGAPGQNAVPGPVQRQALERLGDWAYSAGDHRQANQYYRQALALAAAQQASAAQLCGLLQRLALNYERAGDIPQALECWNSAAAHIAKLGEVVEDSEAVSDVLTRYASFSVRHQPAQVKPLIEQSLRIQQRAYRGYSLAAARAYEVFAGFMVDVNQPAARVAHLQKALMLYQVCDPDNLAHIAELKKSIAVAQAMAEQHAASTAQNGGPA